VSQLVAEDIIQSIRGDASQRRKAILSLTSDAELRNKIHRYIRNNNGSQTEAETVYNDMLVTFIKIVHTRDTFTLDRPLHAYLMGIAKNLWYNEIRKRAKASTTDIDNVAEQRDESITAVELLIKGDRAEILNKVLGQMKTKCKEVLMYWSGGYKMQEIAKLLGYKSDGVARKKKSECMKELLSYLADKPYIKKQLSKI